MATEHFTIKQGGLWRGFGEIDTETGNGKILLKRHKYRFKSVDISNWDGDVHESLSKLPGPGCNQPPVAESSDDVELPF